MVKYEIRATVCEVSEIGMHVEPEPMSDGEESLSPVNGMGRILVAFPDGGRANGRSAKYARAFGALIGVKGAVVVTVETGRRMRSTKRRTGV